MFEWFDRWKEAQRSKKERIELEKEYRIDKEIEALRSYSEDLTSALELWIQKAAAARKDGLMDTYKKIIKVIVQKERERKKTEAILMHIDFIRSHQHDATHAKGLSRSLSIINKNLGSIGIPTSEIFKWSSQYNQILDNIIKQGEKGQTASDTLSGTTEIDEDVSVSVSDIEARVNQIVDPKDSTSDLLNDIDSALKGENHEL